MFDARTTTSLDWQSNSLRPQASQLLPFLAAPDEIAKYATGGMSSAWSGFISLFTAIMEHTRNNDAEVIDDSIDDLLGRIGRRQTSCHSFFPDLRHFVECNLVQQEECKTFIRTFVADLVLNHPYIQAEQVLPTILYGLPLTAKSSIPAAPQETALLQRLAESIRRNYKGNAHRRLLNFVINVNRVYFQERPKDKRPYLKCTPIVQSSGTGKTRMVLELGRISPLLFLCVRHRDATARNGYPLGDEPIMTFVFEDCAAFSLTRDEQAAVLLATWFTTLTSRLTVLSDSNAKSDFLLQLNKYGDERHRHERHAFLRAVVSPEPRMAAFPESGADRILLILKCRVSQDRQLDPSWRSGFASLC